MSSAEHLSLHFCSLKLLEASVSCGDKVLGKFNPSCVQDRPSCDLQHILSLINHLLNLFILKRGHSHVSAYSGFPGWEERGSCWCCRTAWRCRHCLRLGSSASREEQDCLEGTSVFLRCYALLLKPRNLKLQWQVRLPLEMESRQANFSHHALCKSPLCSWVYFLKLWLPNWLQGTDFTWVLEVWNRLFGYWCCLSDGGNVCSERPARKHAFSREGLDDWVRSCIAFLAGWN